MTNKVEKIALKLHIIEHAQRPVKEVKEQIQYWQNRNFGITMAYTKGEAMPEDVQNEIKETEAKIKALKWTLYDDES